MKNLPKATCRIVGIQNPHEKSAGSNMQYLKTRNLHEEPAGKKDISV